MEAVRREVLFAGRVQGVGFRYTVVSLASGYDVAGTVRNLSDGRVELVAEGAPSALDGFIAAIEREMKSNIRERTVSEALASGHFKGFRIIH
jgi:acylphosphatase